MSSREAKEIDPAYRLLLYFFIVITMGALVTLAFNRPKPPQVVHQPQEAPGTSMQQVSPSTQAKESASTESRGIMFGLMFIAGLLAGTVALHVYTSRPSPVVDEQSRQRSCPPPKNPQERLVYAKELVAFSNMSGAFRDFAKIVIHDHSLTLTWFREAGLDSKDLDVIAGLFLEIEAEKIAEAA